MALVEFGVRRSAVIAAIMPKVSENEYTNLTQPQTVKLFAEWLAIDFHTQSTALFSSPQVRQLVIALALEVRI